MKNLISTFLIIIFIVFNCGSQEVEKKMLLKNEISVSYGFASAQVIYDDADYTFFASSRETKISGFGGPISIAYKRIFDGCAGVEIIGLYTAYNTQFINSNNNSILHSSTNKFYSILAKFDFYYLTNEWAQLYSGLGIGVTSGTSSLKYSDQAQTQNYEKTFPAAQITFFSLRVGKQIGGYFEFGFGTNGILNLGLSYKF